MRLRLVACNVLGAYLIGLCAGRVPWWLSVVGAVWIAAITFWMIVADD